MKSVGMERKRGELHGREESKRARRRNLIIWEGGKQNGEREKCNYMGGRKVKEREGET